MGAILKAIQADPERASTLRVACLLFLIPRSDARPCQHHPDRFCLFFFLIKQEALRMYEQLEERFDGAPAADDDEY